MSVVGVVLSGGGARGAYEAGVLSYVYGDFVKKTGRVARFDIASGSSVGAVTGAFLASIAHEPVKGVEKLVQLWQELEFSRVLSFGLRELTFLPRVWLGGAKPQGLFDAEPLARLIGSNISWLNLRRNIRRGVMRAFTLATTHVATGRTHVFVEMCPAYVRPDNVGRSVVMRRGPLSANHVLASAAIPLVFPMVEINGELHCDGGLRANTPTAPTIHLGADRLFIVGLSAEKRDKLIPTLTADRAPGASFLFGKVLDAFFLDHLDEDIREIERINEYMEIGTSAFGPDFISTINQKARERGKPERLPVRLAVIRPSIDLGQIAHEYLSERTGKRAADSFVAHALLRAIDVGQAAEADLASFLLFDAGYAQLLIDLGRRDAARKHDELADFFFS